MSFHGEDLRSRGVMPFIDQVSNLNLTNELDLLDIKFQRTFFLPFETSRFEKKRLNKKLRVAMLQPIVFKGSNHIIRI